MSAKWLWDSAKFSLGATQKLALLPDWPIICHPQAYRVFSQAQVADPEQREEFHNFASHGSKAMFLFDIGAHFGVFSLAAAHFGGKVVAVDPSPTAARMIKTQAVLNGLTDSIRILQAAVSDANGSMELLSAGVFTYGYFKVAKGRPRIELTRTRSITVDQMVNEFGPPTHIKIDVEGHEAAVLRGGRATLNQFSPVLFLELHNEMIASEGGDPGRALHEIAELGYKMFALNGESVERAAILDRPITRIVAKRVTRPAHTSC